MKKVTRGAVRGPHRWKLRAAACTDAKERYGTDEMGGCGDSTARPDVWCLSAATALEAIPPVGRTQTNGPPKKTGIRHAGRSGQRSRALPSGGGLGAVSGSGRTEAQGREVRWKRRGGHSPPISPLGPAGRHSPALRLPRQCCDGGKGSSGVQGAEARRCCAAAAGT